VKGKGEKGERRKGKAKRELRPIADQLLRSGTGIASNAEEATSAYSRRIFALKNSYAPTEARESQLWLRLIVQCELCENMVEAKRMLQEFGELTFYLSTARARQSGIAASDR
jgi:four helix bundle protein